MAFRSIGPALGVGAGALGLTALTRSIRSVVAESSELGKVADLLGVNVEALQELRYAAELAGVSQNAFDMALQRFTRRAAEAAQGTGEAKDALKELGIELTDSEGNLRPTEELLRDVADAFTKVENASERVRIAQKLFDSEGVRMVNMLRNGAAGIDDMTQKAREAGAVLDEDLVRAAERVDDRFATLAKTVGTGFKTAVLEAVDAVDILLERFREVENRSIIGPIDRELDALALKSRAIKESMASHQEILSFDPNDEAARQAMEAHQRELDAILERYEALVARRQEFVQSQATPARGEGGGGGGGGDDDDKQADKLARITDAIRHRTEALRLEAETMGLSTHELERRRMAMELEQAMQSAGIPITEETRQQIDELADAYGRAAVKVEEASAAQAEHRQRTQQSQQAAEQFAQTMSTALTDIVVRGKDASEVMKELAIKIAAAVVEALILAAIQAALGVPVGSAGGGSGGGMFAGLFGARERGGPVQKGRPYVVGEKRPELFVPNQNGMILPKVPEIGGRGGGGGHHGSGGAGSGGNRVTINQTIDARGADPGVEMRMRAALDEQNRNLPRMIRDAVSRGRL